jgi:hypothetical protein
MTSSCQCVSNLGQRFTISEELNQKTDAQTDEDESNQSDHRGGSPSIGFVASSLPLVPPDVGFPLKGGRNERGHRRACWMLSDIVCRGSLHIHGRKMSGSSARLARMVQPATDVTPNASPTAHIAITQRADVTFLFRNFISKCTVTCRRWLFQKEQHTRS